MSSNVNRQWLFAERPEGKLGVEHFGYRESAVPTPGPGQVLVRHRVLQLMPGNRSWMQRDTYRSPLETDQVMPGYAIGEVVASNDLSFKPGDVVETMLGWQDYALASAAALKRRDTPASMEDLMGLLGLSGLTAYFGLLHVGRPRAGETLLVSAAAGGIGSVVAQLGRISGCRVVGIAGGPEKCAWLLNEVGLDAVVDYKAGDLADALSAACPNGVDLYFDNVGGRILEAALDVLKFGGRIVCCGATAHYDSDTPSRGPLGLPLKLIVKSLTMHGFANYGYGAHEREAESNLLKWLSDGSLKTFYHIVEGLEKTPEALVGMMAGMNRGMLLVRV
jgi:NADPH-dependent curcumin reductase CurA